MWTVAVLGPVDVRRDGVRVAVPAGKTTEVLVRLALDAGTVVRAERLSDDLWSESRPGIARNTLQSKVSKLRRALGEPSSVVSRSSGYLLLVDPGSVDALAVARSAESATALREAGDPEGALSVCTTALARFGGDILPDAGEGAWVTPYRTRLTEVLDRLHEDRLAARLDLGSTGELVGELQQLVTAHPLRETLWKLLITALYRAGRQADALDAYRQVRRQLGDELGLDPGAELQSLELRILQHDPALTTPPTPVVQQVSVAPPPTPARGNLPAVSRSMVGRADALEAVSRLRTQHRLVTIVGPAGVGKTRLATEVARAADASDGAWLVRLESARTGPAIWQTIGEAFSLNAATEPMVLDRLRGADLVLLLDNCEHLSSMLPGMVDRILTGAPGLRVLATSQLPLGVESEVCYRLDPLALSDAVTLFTERALHQRPNFRSETDNTEVIEAVCQSLDGLPLAIELAAARTKVLSLPEIARRLDDRFTLLADPTSIRPPRQRALGAAIAWSYDLLFPDDQRGLWALSCCTGGASLAALEQILAALGVPAAAALDVASRLADRSLVQVEIRSAGEARYELLDSVRAFSRDRLTDAGLAEVAQRGHATWIADAADRAALGTRGPEQATHLAVATTERANIDAALAWALHHDPLLGLRIATGFGWARVVLGAGPEDAKRVRAAVAAADPAAEPRERAAGLLLAGWLEASGGNLDQATTDIESARAIGDDEQRSTADLHLAFVRSQQGRAIDAIGLLTRCRDDFLRRGRAWEAGASWLLLAWAEIALGQIVRGRAACDEALALIEPLGDSWGLVHVESMLGSLSQAEQRFADAISHLTRAVDAAHQLGFGAAEAHHLTNLGRAQQQSGDDDNAAATLEHAVAVAEAYADLRTAALARVRLARLRRNRGDAVAARVSVTAARRWYDATGGGDGADLADFLLAALDVDDGAPYAGLKVSEVLDGARLRADREVEVLALDLLARIRAEQGDDQEAASLLDLADQAMTTAGHLLSDHDRIDRDRARAHFTPLARSSHRPQRV